MPDWLLFILVIIALLALCFGVVLLAMWSDKDDNSWRDNYPF